ncbi:amidohydrolase [Ornithinimicrobium sp. W1665]|uniref:amidohydrolase n=1 Tax=Ornithinimicrobium sp. W1665 TaxID=3416666 RepID=UPI003D6C5523
MSTLQPQPQPERARSSSAPGGRVLLHGGVLAGATSDDDVSGAAPTALVLDGSTVAWVGDEAGASAWHDRVDRVVDLDGALVTPGFADAHVHLTMTGQGLDGVDLSRTRSVREALDLVEQAVRRRRGRPVYAHSWDETRWAEGRPVTSAELDRASYGGVVYMPRVDAHSASLSTAMATIARVREIDGWDGTGVVRRDAFAAATNAFTTTLTPADREHHVSLALRAAAAAGITLLHEMGAAHLTGHDDIRAVLAHGEAPGVPDVVTYWGELVDDADAAAELAGFLGVLGLAGDLCADGSFGSFTAHVEQPYLGAPSGAGEEGHHVGFGYLGVDEVRDHVLACTRAGLQAGGHVIGDAALRTMATGFRAAAEELGVEAVRAARHRWEHVELPSPQVLATMAELGVWASVQPVFDALWGGSEGMYAARLGPERALSALPLRDMVDAGIRVALGSDSPVTPRDRGRRCVRPSCTTTPGSGSRPPRPSPPTRSPATSWPGGPEATCAPAPPPPTSSGTTVPGRPSPPTRARACPSSTTPTSPCPSRGSPSCPARSPTTVKEPE